eukprot:GFUD01136025.1.p1 GENE.GFUD01136025.1~~GFUD01136025.1.p1  ORF type:complete len:103 (+),score=29.22 GFUD01136025.1:3-311(+)
MRVQLLVALVMCVTIQVGAWPAFPVGSPSVQQELEVKKELFVNEVAREVLRTLNIYSSGSELQPGGLEENTRQTKREEEKAMLTKREAPRRHQCYANPISCF